MRDVTLQSTKNKSVHSCRFVHHAKFHRIMTTLDKHFKTEFEGLGLQKSLRTNHGSAQSDRRNNVLSQVVERPQRGMDSSQRILEGMRHFDCPLQHISCESRRVSHNY